MNRSLAQWLAGNPVGAVLVTGLLGLLPLFGVGVAFFLPGAVPALVVLVRGERQGVIVAVGASLLLAAAMLTFGRPLPVGFIYSAWVLGPPLLLAVLLRRTDSLSLCLQVAALVGTALLVLLHVSLGDPQQFWAPFVRDLAYDLMDKATRLGSFDLLEAFSVPFPLIVIGLEIMRTRINTVAPDGRMSSTSVPGAAAKPWSDSRNQASPRHSSPSQTNGLSGPW